MLAVIQQTENGYTARFERRLKHPVEKVWAMLTENGKLAKWFSELHVEDLREGGTISFNMGDGTFETMTIQELKLYEVLEYTWAKDIVRFELYPEQDGCRLVLIEKITQITSHSSKDLAGWHVCLDVIEALLDGKNIDNRREYWEAWHEKYVSLVSGLSRS